MFNKISSFENLLLAYQKARKSKRYKKYVLEFSDNLEKNIIDLRNELRSGDYSPSGYKEFVIYEPKRREIKAPAFRDRVVHHSVYKIIEPIFDNSFIYDSYACRKGKGTHKGVYRLKKFLRSIKTKEKQKNQTEETIYCLNCDVSKYFASVNHKILFSLLNKKIKEKKVLILLWKLIRSSEDSPGTGIPIGNLTSQLFANIYLNELDQFIKHSLREKYYIRYMDDFVILGSDKKHLHKIKKKIENFLFNKLKLKLNPKKIRLFPIRKGVDFLGYVVFKDYILLRGSTLKRWKSRFKKIENSKDREELIASWYGYTKHADAYRVFFKYLKKAKQNDSQK